MVKYRFVLYFLLVGLSLLVVSSCIIKRTYPCEVDEANLGTITLKKEVTRKNASLLKGNVVDLNTNEPIVGASIVIDSNGRAINGVITNNNGEFNQLLVPEGKYTIKINSAEYMLLSMPLKVKEPHYTINLAVKMDRIIIRLEKPVIYLYPTQKQAIHVQLNYKGQLTHTYPTYASNGWHVTAEPNGTLYDKNGQEYYALFWEGIPKKTLQATTGFVVPGNRTAQFLEEKLAYLGLNRREANEFIMYWLPRMENNPYNFIHFSDADYTALAELSITPKPETIIRVMMLTKPLYTKIAVPEQDLGSLHKTRKGYTVVEWGGGLLETAL